MIEVSQYFFYEEEEEEEGAQDIRLLTMCSVVYPI